MKKLVSILLVLALAFSFSACSDNDKSEKRRDSAKSGLSDQKDTNSEKPVTAVKIENASVGSYITFGKYEQDNNTSNGEEPLSWIVLDVQGDKALLLTSSLIESMPFDDTQSETTWENCSLRKWLNDEFYNKAFSAGEKMTVLKTTVTAEPNVTFNTDAGNDTQDNVFLLSELEASTYFADNISRRAYGTMYAKENGLYVSTYSNCPGTSYWWLRSPGLSLRSAATVQLTGHVEKNYGDGIYSDSVGVRPAIWVKLG